MQNRLVTNQKVYLLLISIEALNVYKLKNINFSTYRLINVFRTSKKTLKTDRQKNKLVLATIQIYITQLLITSNDIQKLTNKIINKKNKYFKKKLIKQYLKKFYYIYYKMYENHNQSLKYNDKYKLLYINNIAITNLYIINKSCQKKGHFWITNYLSHI
uniref:Ribosomal protein S7 n=1 Tax=Platysiphonia delicata TaxID=2006979 RepID=A0A1Z1M1M7_9FLOR|nr:hypothetical protein [Platysiphonia delicata]ARW59684.1 hypothetical protein [Platysiphonia delicata]